MSFLRPVLYGSWSSSCTWRVRCALHHKGIEFDVQPMAKDDLRSDEFQRLNPFGQIPIFIHGKNILTESLAIMDFLEDEYLSTQKLYPKDHFEKAVAKSLALNIISGIQPLQSGRFLNTTNGIDREQWQREFLHRAFTALESRLKTTSGRFCVGDEISVADCCLQPLAFKAAKIIDITDFPKIQEIDETLARIPAFQRSHPFVQPDAPDEVRRMDEVNHLPRTGYAIVN
ncbi:putative maleylacetoacetate isomerase 2 isoform X2 [Aphelenchoides besseyi]|nr:putative maleylacetoacetate isomerase 2 isoform X2 [Aphelenchoides besseyi]KAI6195256.1 putative maleylacetoacetate isomerase 2 isoform X2 [Aphelenchoides besseyi]